MGLDCCRMAQARCSSGAAQSHSPRASSRIQRFIEEMLGVEIQTAEAIGLWKLRCRMRRLLVWGLCAEVDAAAIPRTWVNSDFPEPRPKSRPKSRPAPPVVQLFAGIPDCAPSVDLAEPKGRFGRSRRLPRRPAWGCSGFASGTVQRVTRFRFYPPGLATERLSMQHAGAMDVGVFVAAGSLVPRVSLAALGGLGWR